uniref:Uncharacterized protein n=1 Tax=Romanomermis culicivorax TaxID=13658 RepID=A0A915I4B4_ROMCU
MGVLHPSDYSKAPTPICEYDKNKYGDYFHTVGTFESSASLDAASEGVEFTVAMKTGVQMT